MKFKKLDFKLLKRIFCILLILSLLPLPINNPKTVSAGNIDGHSTYYAKTFINEATLSYEVNIEYDEKLWGKSAEKKADIPWGEIFKSYKTNSSGKKSADIFGFLDRISPTGTYSETKISDGSTKLTENIDDNSGLIFSFPGFKREEDRFAPITGDNANQDDMNKAYDISERLVNNLNALIKNMAKEMNISFKDANGKNDINKLISASIALRPTKTFTDSNNRKWKYTELNQYYQIWYALDEGTTDGRDNLTGNNNTTYKVQDIVKYLPSSDSKNNLYCYLIRVNSGEVSKLTVSRLSPIVWAMPKGYIDVKTGLGFNSKNFEDKKITDVPSYALTKTKIADYSDTAYMTIFHYSYFANYNYIINGKTASASDTSESGVIAKAIYSLLSSILYGVKKLLGLEDIYDLIYNGGIRGTSAYEEGTMNSQWWNNVLKYHMIFQIIAWMLIGFAVAKILLELNLSTINPQKRMFIMETFQKLFTVGFLLALSIPIIKALVSTNNMIVDIFRTQAQQDMEAFTMNGNIASIVSYLAYFGILVVINCMYIMRSIMIAILAASAPFFIVTMAFSSKGQGLFSVWFKEITANIFMQSIHAFAFAFLFDIIDYGKTIERIVVFWSLIPIVDMFRGLIFQNSGGFTSGQGQMMGSMVNSGINNIASGIGRGAMNASNKKFAEKNGISLNEEAGVSGGSGSGSGSGTSRNDSAFSTRANMLKQLEEDKQAQGVGTLGNKFERIMTSGAGKAVQAGLAIGQMGVSANLRDTHGFNNAAQSLGQVASDISETAFGKLEDGKEVLGNEIGASKQQNRMNKLNPELYKDEYQAAYEDYKQDSSNPLKQEAFENMKNKYNSHKNSVQNMSNKKMNKIQGKIDKYNQSQARRHFESTGGNGRVISGPRGTKTAFDVGQNGIGTITKLNDGRTSLNIDTQKLNQNDVLRTTADLMKDNQDFAKYMNSKGYRLNENVLSIDNNVSMSKNGRSAIVDGNTRNDMVKYIDDYNKYKANDPNVQQIPVPQTNQTSYTEVYYGQKNNNKA